MYLNLTFAQVSSFGHTKATIFPIQFHTPIYFLDPLVNTRYQINSLFRYALTEKFLQSGVLTKFRIPTFDSFKDLIPTGVFR